MFSGHPKQAACYMTPNLHRDWVIVCFGRASKHFQKWKSTGLITLRLVQSRGMKTAQRLYKKSLLHVPISRF